MKSTTFRCSLIVLAFIALGFTTQQVKSEQVQQNSELDRKKLEMEFQKSLTGVVLVGHYTAVDQKADGQDGLSPKSDRYTITKVSKLQNDVWLFLARIQFGKNDVTVPMPIRVKWAGDTPVITLTDVLIPGLGTYTSRVVVYRGRYAGTWSGGDHAGHLWGKIERIKSEEVKEKLPPGQPDKI